MNYLIAKSAKWSPRNGGGGSEMPWTSVGKKCGANQSDLAFARRILLNLFIEYQSWSTLKLKGSNVYPHFTLDEL